MQLYANSGMNFMIAELEFVIWPINGINRSDRLCNRTTIQKQNCAI